MVAAYETTVAAVDSAGHDSKHEGWLYEVRTPTAKRKSKSVDLPEVNSVWVQVSRGHLRIRHSRSTASRIFDVLDADRCGVFVREDILRLVILHCQPLEENMVDAIMLEMDASRGAVDRVKFGVWWEEAQSIRYTNQAGLELVRILNSILTSRVVQDSLDDGYDEGADDPEVVWDDHAEYRGSSHADEFEDVNLYGCR